MRKLTHEEIAGSRLSRIQASEAIRMPIWALLDNIRSLYNVGSIFRSSDGALIQKLYLCGYTPRPPRKEIEKTALGSTETVPWEYFSDPLSAVSMAKKAGARVYALEHTTKSIPYYEVNQSHFPICLVVGNEITGISPEVIEAADMAIEIPMFGTKQSLNAAVAYGIALYDLVRIFRKSSVKTTPL